MARRRKKLPQQPVSANIESLSHEGRGIAHVDGKTVFVNGGLPGEEVSFQYKKQRSKYDEAQALEITNPAAQRINARCEFFGLCGGCSLQHMQHDFQIEHKQAVLMEQLTHIGNIKPKSIIPPLTGPQWGYRRKARLGVKFVEKKGKVLVGFREKYSPFVADMSHCEVLHPSVGLLLEPLQTLVADLSLIKQIPQIEVAIGDDVSVLVFRHLADFSEDDMDKLRAFGEEHKVHVYCQSGGLDTVLPLPGTTPPTLSYSLPEYDVVMNFLPTDFTQVNYEINRQMVHRALELLEVDSTDRVLDLFCGIGNFTLPLARKAASVFGIEGEQGLVERAKQNALSNNINNAEFRAIDLTKEDLNEDFRGIEFFNKGFNKLLLDPARNGAQEVIEKLNLSSVDRIVYVSCNPATLARDAGILVNSKGFKLAQAGIMDMFPHTTHVESIAVFVR